MSDSLQDLVDNWRYLVEIDEYPDTWGRGYNTALEHAADEVEQRLEVRDE